MCLSQIKLHSLWQFSPEVKLNTDTVNSCFLVQMILQYIQEVLTVELIRHSELPPNVAQWSCR